MLIVGNTVGGNQSSPSLQEGLIEFGHMLIAFDMENRLQFLRSCCSFSLALACLHILFNEVKLIVSAREGT